MSYAIRKDGKGWRSVNGPDDVGMDEVFSETQPILTTTQKTYADLRAAEFAKKSIGEQLDMQYWDAVNGTTLWVDWVASIKAQFPKP